MPFADDQSFMREALDQAARAAEVGEVPIGAVVVYEGRVVARAHNRRELDEDPSAHAEFSAMLQAARELGRWRLSGCTVYVTLEPCAMCAGLMVNARVDRCVFGAADAKAGALGSMLNLAAQDGLNHAFEVTSGVLANECAGVLTSYFDRIRRERDVTKEAHAAHGESLARAEDRLEDAPCACVRQPRVVLAIDSFKGSATSGQAEAWVEEGLRRVWPNAQVERVLLADGGEGTIDAFRAGVGGDIVTAAVRGPLGVEVRARYVLGDGWAALETAEAAGITQSPRTAEAALAASTFGVGQLVLQAVAHGARRVYLGLGGSATNDGGAGFLQALGAELLDADGQPVAPGLAGVSRVASINLEPALAALAGVELCVLSDVTNPLVGARGALAVFGKQKGLPTDDAAKLAKYDGWMLAYGKKLDEVRSASERFGSVLGVPGAGAAGGLGAALLALGASLQSGVQTVLDAIGFDDKVANADLVITGEGNMDVQSAAGKAPVGVAQRAKRFGKPVVAVVGGRAQNLDAVYGQGVDLVLPICRKPMPLDEALSAGEAHRNLVCAGEATARAFALRG